MKRFFPGALKADAGTVTGEQNVGAAAAENAVPVGMHLVQVVLSVDACQLPLVICGVAIVRFVLLRGRKHLDKLGRFHSVFGVEVPRVTSAAPPPRERKNWQFVRGPSKEAGVGRFQTRPQSRLTSSRARSSTSCLGLLRESVDLD